MWNNHLSIPYHTLEEITPKLPKIPQNPAKTLTKIVQLFLALIDAYIIIKDDFCPLFYW